MKYLLIPLLLLFGAPVLAQSVSGVVNIAWTLPTTGCTAGVSPCNNKPLTGADALTGVKVYVSTAPISDTTILAPVATLGPGVTTTTYTTNVTNGSTIYVRVRATNASGDGPLSNQASQVVALPVLPGVPTSVTISITITP